ncbi:MULTISPECIES: SAM-dependent methyltransferase [unclassified Mycolicibacterium]|uniref:SAM-dependent methyltransferase n=1 Tax=unclassified Mycolicibacterium TaxID=2636767 RepID=UPI0012DBCF4D|nr:MULTISPECIES: SAM-dependent methyltransferase [unclassified Mycolicibacterium]MUL82109.1 SAM-dependent methyltransferase [Mycolicibacterium sp. CBMA 329]MUL87875.1 SAM-dependent methyltransferase [Mycolicibacterium sp. CBMA 331]MUM01698.1 SAM-dependent methyltransferase [Mycolicibacterium sp. CBMA 334]MUM28432.1 SAM-dependent methyltransferase [Mycolicibacterium sp. CBMA 295]MUM38172.1 SAM-dependent methyltransferase [Mycolicibacterium sp. CBMA 247]
MTNSGQPPGQAVADTGILVAAIRAEETRRPDRLFTDPFAQKLAGESGQRMLVEAVAASGDKSTLQIVVRTRFWDEALLNAVPPVRQVVILAAGLDARAYRLPWADGTTVFELDQPAVIAAKADALAGDEPRCRRVAIGVDLTEDWTDALRANGFDPGAPAVWLIEGLLQYLDEDAVHTVFERVDAMSAPGSVLLYDIVGKTLLDNVTLAAVRERMARNGAPWLFGTDAPGQLCEGLGWSAVVTDVAEPGNKWNRWFAPAVPLEVPGVPRGYFVTATK